MEAPLSARAVDALNTRDVQEDLQDRPPIPATLIYPDGRSLHLSVSYFEKKIEKGETDKDKKGKGNRFSKGLEKASFKKLILKIDSIFLIYAPHHLEEEERLRRLVHWLEKIDKGGLIEARSYEASLRYKDRFEEICQELLSHYEGPIQNLIKEYLSSESFQFLIERSNSLKTWEDEESIKKNWKRFAASSPFSGEVLASLLHQSYIDMRTAYFFFLQEHRRAQRLSPSEECLWKVQSFSIPGKSSLS